MINFADKKAGEGGLNLTPIEVMDHIKLTGDILNRVVLKDIMVVQMTPDELTFDEYFITMKIYLLQCQKLVRRQRNVAANDKEVSEEVKVV